MNLLMVYARQSMIKGSKTKIQEYIKLVKANPKKYSMLLQRVNQLIGEGINISLQGKNGNTLLHTAVSLESERLLTMYLKLGVKPDLANDAGDAPIHKAIMKGNLKLVKLLVEHGADINCPREMEQTPLHLAVINGNMQIVEYLVDKGADFMIIDEINNFPIDYAIDERDINIINYFLKRQTVDEKRAEQIKAIMNGED